jgi:ABC-2 type transport system ATP-binding protein
VAGLGTAIDKRVRSYSQGMRQRVAIAQAMLGLPDLLVLDEPTNGLDPPQIHAMREVLRSYAESGRTVIVSSHLLAEIEQTADHFVVISQGRSVFQGGLGQLRGSRRPRVLVRCAAPVPLAEALARAGVVEIDTLPDGRLAVADADPVRVGDIALAAGVAVYGMVEEKIDLEQLFFQLTTGRWMP